MELNSIKPADGAKRARRRVVGPLQQPRQVGTDLHLLLAFDLGQALDGTVHRRLQRPHVGPGALQQRARAVLLAQHGGQQVQGIDVGVVVAQCQGLGVGQGFLELGGELVDSHGVKNLQLLNR